MTEFKTGMVVQLKSGGPPMTVVQVGTGISGGEHDIICRWFSGLKQNKLEKAVFKPEALEVYGELKVRVVKT